MQPLDKTLRSQLERAVKAARDTAETGARAALEQLGVGDPAPASHLSETDRELRRKLRAHGRQLGDALNGGKVQTMERLVEEVAYEHWHRMLFARFLAENDLLMYPDPDEPVAITLEECEDLAADEGAANGWELAARYAARMLPQIFRLDSPVFQLTLPPEHQQALERQVAGLPLEVFTASDSLGWVYQFWQSKKKEQVNQSEVKIGARELPAVTQLFTEPYMVSFLLDNSLGAWWASRQLSESDLKRAESEDELRHKAAIPGVTLEYLRFVRQEDGAGNKRWTPAAGTFDAWPEQLADLKTLDPCCGSGHFLVAAFLMLVPMRMERDGLSARDAVDAVLRENIHGLELDQRCVELAAFALALAAWKYPGAEGYRPLPELHVACSGLSISAKKEEWLALAGDSNDLRIALEELYRQFKDAPILGSLINPEVSLGRGSLFELKWKEVGPLLTKALAGEKDSEKAEMGVVAQGIAKASTLLSTKYKLVVTNFPFLGLERQDKKLAEYLKKHHDVAKRDLATSFLKRSKSFTVKGGITAVVMPGEWTFKPSHRHMREWLLRNSNIPMFCSLGRDAFSTGLRVTPVLPIVQWSEEYEDHAVQVIEIEGVKFNNKSAELAAANIVRLPQNYWKTTPDMRLSCKAGLSSTGDNLGKYCDARLGISAGDGIRFERLFWELFLIDSNWRYLQGAVPKDKMHSGCSAIVHWEQESGGMYELAQSVKHLNHAAQNWQRGRPFWQKKGLLISQMGGVTNYTGEIFDSRTLAIVPDDSKHIEPLIAFAFSGSLMSEVKKLDDGYKINSPRTFLDVHFEQEKWREKFMNMYPLGFPKPFSNDHSQWFFHGHPCGSVVWDEEQKWTTEGPLRTDDTVLQVAVARLLGYRWPAELDADMELADEQREWVKRCEALLPFADDDGIVCIPPVRGEASAADRLLNLLAAAYGDAWSTDVLAELLKSADHAGKTLDTWLRDKFFTQHCKLFQHRPFIWHIWDGLPDGFAALVNYHKLDRKSLETLIYTYLGDWISRQKQDLASGVDGAEERLAAAESLKKKLEQILEGEAPYDIFVRWKPIEQQPIGWDPDLNDGVRLNIRPFMTVGDVKKKDAGILRDKPNIKWTKDRGKDVESAPWYQTFKGERINEHHLTLAEKRAAREKVQ